MCPSWKAEEEAPNPHKKEELLLAPEKGDQDLHHLVLRTQLQQPLSLHGAERRDHSNPHPLPKHHPIYLQDLQTDKLNEFHSCKVQRQCSLNGL